MSIQPGCQFASDNTAGICPEAMSAMTEANQDSAKPYGEDPWTKRAISLIREVFEVDCDVFYEMPVPIKINSTTDGEFPLIFPKSIVGKLWS